MQVTISKADLVNPAVRQMIVDLISDAKHGGFMRVHALRPKTGHGEVSDYTFCKGISYPNAVAKSLAMLDALDATIDFAVTVTRGVWTDDNGNINPTNRKSKEFHKPKTITETYSRNSPEMKDALLKLRISLVAPAAPTKEYKSLGNGVYEDEGGKLYIRDLRLVSKNVIQHGGYPFEAKGAVTAIQDAIKKSMPVGNYRQFNLDGDYAALTFGGMEISVENVEEKANAEVAEVAEVNQEKEVKEVKQEKRSEWETITV